MYFFFAPNNNKLCGPLGGTPVCRKSKTCLDGCFFCAPNNNKLWGPLKGTPVCRKSRTRLDGCIEA